VLVWYWVLLSSSRVFSSNKELKVNLKAKDLVHPYKTIQLAKSRLLTKPTRSLLLTSFLRRFVQPCKPEKWVFIMGCYNSGTTLLERMLVTHPAISALDEGVFKTDQLITPEELGWPRMWCQVVDQVRLTASDKDVDVEKLRRDWAVFFDRRRSIFLEKSIVNSARMPWLQANFKNSYFIFIVRNGYAVAEGIRRKTAAGKWLIPTQFGGSYPIELCAKQWVVNNEIVECDSVGIENFRTIRYEEICKAPRKSVEELWEFIGLQEGPNWSKDTKWQIQEKHSQIANMNYRSFKNLSSEDIVGIENVAAKTLEHYGYPVLSKGI